MLGMIFANVEQGVIYEKALFLIAMFTMLLVVQKRKAYLRK